MTFAPHRPEWILDKMILKFFIAIFENIEKFHEFLPIFDTPPLIYFFKIILSKIHSGQHGANVII